MLNFKIAKEGYNPADVEDYIQKLKDTYEARLAEQKTKLSYLQNKLSKTNLSDNSELIGSLLSAMEKAKRIEDRSRNIYKLEAKKLTLLYSKMEKVLQESDISDGKNLKQELLGLIQSCRESLKDTMEIQNRETNENQVGDPVKRLLLKMINLNKTPPGQRTLPKTLTNVSASSKPQSNNLSSDESGFDLMEAIHPKEDLSEIMKSFDFYNKMKKDN